MKNRSKHPLRIARQKHNLTIHQLAEMAKLGVSTIWRAEQGYLIGAESRQRLCAYFQMTSQELGLAEVESGEITPPAAEISGRSFFTVPAINVTGSPLNSSPLVLENHSPLDTFLAHEGTVSPEQQLGSWLALGSSNLATLFDAGWTLEDILDSLRVVLQGAQGIPSPMRSTLLNMNSSALVHTVHPPMNTHPSQEERQRFLSALNKSVAEGWHLFHKASPAQVLVVAQTLLALVQQAHAFLPADVRPSFYAAIYNLIGASLLFQGQYAAAQKAHEKAQIASLEGADIWSMAQSLNWQAIVAQVRGNYQEALQPIEAALRLLGQRDDEANVRLRAHLLADWAYNAAHLREWARTQEKLEASATLVKPLPLDEEFDFLQWQQVAGSCFTLQGKYSEAIRVLEQALTQLPSSWWIRHLLTLIPLAEAHARAGERDASLTTAEKIIMRLGETNASMFTLRFEEYYQVLCTTFPGDQRVRRFVAQAQRQLLLSPPDV